MASLVSLLLPLFAQLGGVQWGDHEPFARPAGSALGDMLGNIGDWDGDGFDEIAMAVEATNELHIISSATRQTLQVINMQAQFGETGNASKIVRMGDLNDDGVEEFVFSFKRDLAWKLWDKFYLEVYRGSIHLVDGVSLVPIWSAVGQSEFDRLGHVVQPIHDLDGDQKPDMLVSSPHATRGQLQVGYVTFLSSSNGSLLNQVTRAGKGAGFGEGAVLVDDLTGDSIPDLIAGAPAWGTNDSLGRLYAIDLQTRQTIWEIAAPQTSHFNPECFGRWALAADDLNGDGIHDVFVGAKNYKNGWDGAVYGVSAADGTVLWSQLRSIKHEGRNFGPLSVTTPDMDGDGIGDLIVRSGKMGGLLELLSGPTGALIDHTGWWGTTHGLRHVWHEFHSTVVEISDLNDDGFPEYLSMIEHPDALGYRNARTMSSFRCMKANTTEISRSAGTLVELELAFPWKHQALHYVIAASATGATGGPFRNIDLPLDQDALFLRSKDPARPLFPGQWGQLDANGRASIQIDTTGLFGRFPPAQLHLSAIAYDASNSHPKLASRAWTFDILP
jgi:hypothetical protein